MLMWRYETQIDMAAASISCTTPKPHSLHVVERALVCLIASGAVASGERIGGAPECNVIVELLVLTVENGVTKRRPTLTQTGFDVVEVVQIAARSIKRV